MYFNNEQSVSDSECVKVCAPGCQSACMCVRLGARVSVWVCVLKSPHLNESKLCIDILAEDPF